MWEAWLVCLLVVSTAAWCRWDGHDRSAQCINGGEEKSTSVEYWPGFQLIGSGLFLSRREDLRVSGEEN